VGRLDVESVDQVAAHIDTCAECQHFLETASFSLDPILAGLRYPIAGDEIGSDPELQGKWERVIAAWVAPPTNVRDDHVSDGAASRSTPPLQQADTLPPRDSELPDSRPALPDSRPAVARIPESFGRFRIIRALGKGGMGSVYLAHDPQLDRNVALKIPHVSTDAGPEVFERFYRESRAAAKLQHPNICPVHDVGEIDGVQYLVMAHVEGEPLSEVLRRRGALSSPEAAALVRTIALALEDAHEAGVVHRDLKPSNIMINKRGEPVVMDFGLAQLTQVGPPGAERLTQTGAILGTPAYMSPEQVMGDTARIGPASDIYSLGVMLYELVTGRLPFQGRPAAVLGQIIARDPARPSQVRDDVDQRIDPICAKAMAKSVDDRFDSMRSMAAMLDEFVRASLPAADPAAMRARPLSHERAARNRRWGWIAAGLAGIALLLAGVVYFVLTDRGTLVVEAADPSIEAILKKTGLVIRDTETQRSYVIRIGEQMQRSGTYLPDSPRGLKLDVRDDAGLEIQTDEFKLKRGGKIRVLVTLAVPPAKNDTSDLAKPLGTMPDRTSESEREIAEWVLSVGGNLRVVGSDDREVVVHRADELPRGRFQIRFAFLGFGSRYEPEDVNRLAGLANLRRVQLERYAGWDDDVFVPFRDMTQLEALLLRGESRLTGAGLSHLEKCTNLQTLELNTCRLTDAACETLSRMNNLQQLAFGSPHVTTKGIEQIVKISSLNALLLRGTTLSPESANLLKRVRGLRHLECDRATDEVLLRLSELNNLTELWLFRSELTDNGLKHVANLRKLASLVVENAPLTGKSLESLRDLPSLIALNLVDCELDDSAMPALGQLARLQSLNLGRTRITGHGVPHLVQLVDLRELDLSGTRITDDAIAELGKIRALKFVSLSNTLVTAEGRRKLRQSLPDCRIVPE